MKKLLFTGIMMVASLGLAHDYDLDKSKVKLLISSEQIDAKVKDVAHRINDEYTGKEVIVISIMRGAIFFTVDLMRELTIPYTLEVVKCHSYGTDNKRGELKIDGLDKIDVANKHIIIVDDIFDTGTTMKAVKEAVMKKNPASLKTVLLLVKNVAHVGGITPDIALFEIEDHFVFGYGLDYKEYYRGLRGIYYVE
jgi:hypoxanthine phosphoribosyltransferase